MQRILPVLIVLSTPVLLAADDKVRKELKALEGTWKAVALEAGGQALPKDAVPDFTFIVGADGKCTARMAQSEYAAAITLHPEKTPRTIDNLHESGPQEGKKQYGIYKLDGDKWIVCMTRPGVAESDRPKDFATKGTAHVVFVFERVSADKKP